jgi:hypothetical protein
MVVGGSDYIFRVACGFALGPEFVKLLFPLLNQNSILFSSSG